MRWCGFHEWVLIRQAESSTSRTTVWGRTERRIQGLTNGERESVNINYS